MVTKPKVKAVKIRGQWHIVDHPVMSGLKTACGKTVSFGKTVHCIKLDEIECAKCLSV